MMGGVENEQPRIIRLWPEERDEIVDAVPSPTAYLDIIERVADLPEATITLQGTFDEPDR